MATNPASFSMTSLTLKRTVAAILLLLAVVVTASAQSTTVRLEGQVVCCAECWAEADRTKVEFGTAEDLLKAQSCVANGDPTLLAVREHEKFTLYRLEPAKFRLPGKNWLEFIGKRVAVTGVVKKDKIHVDSLEVLAASLAEREAANVVGQEVALTLKDPFGAPQALSSLKGRLVILNFWATYCIPCRAEMPELAAIQNEYAAFGVQVIGASADEVSERAKILQFAKETKVNFPVWLGATTADMVRFGLGGALPGTVVIGRDGRVAKVISGVVNQADLKKRIDVLLVAAENSLNVEPKPAEEPVAIKRKPAEVSSVPS